MNPRWWYNRSMRARLDTKWNPLIQHLCKRGGIDRDKVAIITESGLDIGGYAAPKDGYVAIIISADLDEVETAMGIGHEIRHAVQILTGRLIHGGDHFIFDGQRVNVADGGYWSWPHEVDARRYEQPALQAAFNLGIVSL